MLPKLKAISTLILCILIVNTCLAIVPKIARDLGIKTTSQGHCLSNRKTATSELLKLPANIELPSHLQNDLACLALEINIKHEKTYKDPSVTWREITTSKRPGSKKIQGKLKFSGLAKMLYRYEIRQSQDLRYDVIVRIHVNNWKLWRGSPLFSLPELDKTEHLRRIFELSLREAEKYWDSDELGIKFHFIYEPDINTADFSITLRQSINPSLYNKRWDWWPEEDISCSDDKVINDENFQMDTTIFAHEIGHMMGLEDEYSLPKNVIGLASGFAEGLFHPERDWRQLQTDKWARGCDQSSIMCKDWNKSLSPSKYHYYLILRRYFDEF